jgi:hypothetical protein
MPDRPGRAAELRAEPLAIADDVDAVQVAMAEDRGRAHAGNPDRGP